MIPKKLTLKGVFSYKTEQTIDFEALTASGLFGIFGRVGSGKSSILETILYALYGQLPRFNAQGRWENLMHLQSDEALIDFEFAVHQERYRSVIQQTRKRKKNGSVDKIEGKTTYFIWKKDEWMPFEGFDAAKIIGLNYGDFQQTVIIPQNSFQAFLEQGPTDRTRMLKEIFNLEKYELEAPTKALIEIENQHIAHIDGGLKSLGNVSETDILAQQNFVAQLEKELYEVQQTLTQLKEAGSILADIKKQVDKQQTVAAEWASLMQKKDDFEAKRRTLAAFEAAQWQFKAELQQYEGFLSDIKTGEKALAQLKTDAEKASEAVEMAEKTVAQWAPEYQLRERYVQEAVDWTTWAQIAQLKTVSDALTERQAKGKGIIEQLLNKKTALEQAIQETEQAISAKQALDIDILSLTMADNWYKNIEQQAAKCSELLTQKESLEAKKTAASDAQKATEKACRQHLNLTADAPIDFNNWAEHLQERRRQVSDQQSHALATQQLGQWAAQLSEGSPCPVCGATHHPSVWNAESVENELQSLQNEIIRLDTVLKSLRQFELSWQQYDQQIQVLTGQVQETAQRYAQETAAFKALQNQAPTQLSASAVAEQIALFKTHETALKSLQKQAQSLQNDLKNCQKEWEKCQETMANIEKEGAHTAGTMAALVGSLVVLSEADCQTQDTDGAQALAQQLRQKIDVIDRAYNEAAQHKEAAQKQLWTSEAQRTAQTEQLAALQQKAEAALAALNAKIAASAFNSIEEIMAILAQKYDIVAEKEAIASYEQRCFAVEKEAAALSAWLEGKSYDATKHADILAKIDQQEQLEKMKIGALGGAKNELERQKQEWASIKVLVEKRAQHQDRLQNLSVLRTLFSKSGFVNYVSTIFLRQICHSANMRFKSLTQHQLQLELDDKNNFIIRDMANGGLTRVVKSLSGGQMFQVSLALALALSDHIQAQQRQVQKFFFLDEGFGSLDRESLTVVFEALKALRYENRIVGVISHIEDMQEEISAHLRVTLDPETGSQVHLFSEF